ncbi:MAG: TonB-dependent receptor [Algoriphagus sp.]|nr:TonB-dependent receptor [Algoriphagus sp.]
MRFFYIFSCLLTFGVQSFGQTVRILDSDSKTPLPGVLIFGTETNGSEVSDKNGNANISKFESQNTIHFQLLGFQSLTMSWEEIKKSDFLLKMFPGMIQMDQAIVSATKWRQSSQDVPGKVSVLSASNLQIRNPANSADWLGSSGEVFIQKSQQGGGSPMIRGFSANRLLYAVDGVRMNTAIFRSGNLQNVISVDPFSIQSTEVLFGPGSVMYGSDAIGGVMAFETLKPEFSKDTSLLSGNIFSRFATANNELTLHADVSWGFKKWAFLTSFSNFDYGDLKMGKSGPNEYLRPFYAERDGEMDTTISNSDPRVQVKSGYSQMNLMQKVSFKPSEKTEFDYGFHYSRTGDIPRYDRLIEGNGSALKYAEWYYGPQVWVMNTLGMTHRGESGIFDQMNVKIAHQYFEESRNDRRFGKEDLFKRTEKVNALSLNADFVKLIRNESFLTYGGEWVYNEVGSTGIVENIATGISTPASARYPDSDWNSLAVYSTYHAHFSEKLKLQTGLRYNFTDLQADFGNNTAFYPLPFSEASNSFGSVTGSLGLIFNPEPTLTISPVLSTGFRAPNVDDLGKIFDSEPGMVLVPNPDLKPEYAYNAELNLNKHFNQFLKLDFSGFYTLLDNALVRRPFTLNGETEIDYEGQPSQVFAIQNAASAKIYGFQAGIEFAVTKRILITSRYNWQKGTEELDDESTSPSRHAAPAFGLTRLSYLNKKLRIEFTTQYSREVSYGRMPLEEKGKPHLYAKDELGRPYSPSWMIFNFNTSYQLDPHIHLMAGVENIGDIRYQPYSSGIAAPGRNFTFSIRGSF